jgi:putative component of toxin-antitoxin plasmid stabilization module
VTNSIGFHVALWIGVALDWVLSVALMWQWRRVRRDTRALNERSERLTRVAETFYRDVEAAWHMVQEHRVTVAAQSR